MVCMYAYIYIYSYIYNIYIIVIYIYIFNIYIVLYIINIYIYIVIYIYVYGHRLEKPTDRDLPQRSAAILFDFLRFLRNVAPRMGIVRPGHDRWHTGNLT